MNLTSTEPTLPIRPELRGRTPYGAPQLEVAVQLNTNENPHPPSPALVAAVTRACHDTATGLNRYPDREATVLRAALAGYLTESTGTVLAEDRLWAANGSNEILQQLMQAFAGPGRTVLGFEPTYSMHRTITEATGGTYVSVPRRPDFTIDTAEAVAAVRRLRPDVVFLCNPNSPSGTSSDHELITSLYEAATGLVVIDEAYAEFSGRPSATTLLDGRPRLVVSRTMSKAFAFAGARIGYLAADRALVDALRLVRLPYHLSSLTQAVAVTVLDHRADVLSTLPEVTAQRDRMLRELPALGHQVLPSDANFVLFETREDAATTWRRLLDHQVLVRDVGFGHRLRVTAGTRAETTAFLDAIQALG
ncbi:histidinol-phosphate transaminase [Streptomyces sp. NPDC058045]|uniref:histidinol-phosphate transaminase n=1 Tax=Streptomyces sp. NPDC058045 TaxID=3346311 RepID=UPI0036E2975A